MDRAASLIEKYFRVRDGEIQVGGAPVSTLAEKYGTPLFVYDRHVLDRKWDCLRGALPPRFSVCYSVKANPNQQFLRYFLEKGCGLEIASAGEFHQALSAGCPPGEIIFAGPGKTEAELEWVLEKGIGEIHVE